MTKNIRYVTSYLITNYFKDNIINFNSSIKNIIKDFNLKNINISEVGFYDDCNFFKVEMKNPTYCLNYAKYVKDREYSEEYLKKARKKIPIIVDELHKELVKDGTFGACRNSSMILSRILEKEGFWNYIVNGSLSIFYPNKSKFKNDYFFYREVSHSNIGHVWVVAPPFGVIDISIKQQCWDKNKIKLIPNIVLSESLKTEHYKTNDIVCPEIIEFYNQQGVYNENILKALNIDVNKVKVFKPVSFKSNKTILKYTQVDCILPNESLEKIKGFSPQEKSNKSIKIYENIIKPKLQ